MRRAIVFCVLLGLVCLSCSILLGQQPSKSAAPPPKKAPPAAKAPAKVVVPPPAPGTTRLYPAFSGYDAILLLRPPSDSTGSCLPKTEWKRKLEGDLTGTQYSISLIARSDVPLSEKIPASGIPAGKIRVTILLKRAPSGPLPPHYAEKLREWAKKYAVPNAPPMPDPQNFEEWSRWANSYQNRPSPVIKADPVKDPEGFRKEMQEWQRMSRESERPQLSDLDAEFRKQGLPVRGEILLASTVFDFDTEGKEKLLTATLEGPDPEFLAGDVLVLSVEQLEGYSCVGADSEGSVYIDIPESSFTENRMDAASRVYVITGTLVTKAGAPLANQEVLFLPVDASGNGLTTFGPPTSGGTMFMTNPRTKTNAQGRFTLRVAASDFQRSADPTTGRVQPVESMGSGRLRHVGKGIDVKLTDKIAERIELGRVVVAPQ